MSDTPLQLGNIVKDRISGFEGYLTNRVTWLYGCVRYMVKPNKLTEDGKTIKPESFDADQVIFVDTGEPVPWREEPDIRGHKIRDRVSQLEGICTGYIQTLYGDDEVFLSPQNSKDGKPAETLGLVLSQVEIIEPALEARPVSDRPPGGPRDVPSASRDVASARDSA